MNRGSYTDRAQEAADRAKDARIEEYFDRYPVRVKAWVVPMSGVRMHACVYVAADASMPEIHEALKRKAGVLCGEIHIYEQY